MRPMTFWWSTPKAASLSPGLMATIWAARTAVADRRASRVLIIAGSIGLATIVALAAAIDINGWTWAPLASLFGTLRGRQPGLGYGALIVAAASLMFVCHGLALRGFVRGDAFVAGAIGASVALVGLFTLYPLSRQLRRILHPPHALRHTCERNLDPCRRRPAPLSLPT